jgi:hypothetical protein
VCECGQVVDRFQGLLINFEDTDKMKTLISKTNYVESMPEIKKAKNGMTN